MSQAAGEPAVAAPRSSRALAVARLRRIRLLVLAGVTVVTAGLSAAVASVVPGRSATSAPRAQVPDPFTEPLTAYRPGQSVAPTATDEPPVVVSGPS